jgi:proteasome lid subunit RPN8/RPN11
MPDIKETIENSEENNETILQEEKEQIKTKPIILAAEAYKTIILYASRYANHSLPAKDWKEIYGILTGYTDDDFLYIENAYALTFGHDTDVQLDERHYVFIDEIQQKLDMEQKDHFIVGWFHSHPGLNLFFSYIDLINQLGFQAKFEDAIGLVFDHTLLGEKKKEKVGDGYMTKYDTGFEIYRITDINLDPNSPEFETNYHEVDYIVKGLNKFFFANVLSELSSLVSAGKPLQSAYGEATATRDSDAFDPNKEDAISEIDIASSNDVLVNIPMEDDINFDTTTSIDELVDSREEHGFIELKEKAEKLIFEGNESFRNLDAFSGVEKYKQAIDLYKNIDDIDHVLELLRNVVKLCISTNHYNLVQTFTDEMMRISLEYKKDFYRGVANYIEGYLLLKKGSHKTIKNGLKKIQQSAVLFLNEGDYAGAGMSFNKIGVIYQKQLKDNESACLFYTEAIKNYDKALISSYPLRKSLWSNSELLMEKINELKDLVEGLLPNEP